MVVVHASSDADKRKNLEALEERNERVLNDVGESAGYITHEYDNVDAMLLDSSVAGDIRDPLPVFAQDSRASLLRAARVDTGWYFSDVGVAKISGYDYYIYNLDNSKLTVSCNGQNFSYHSGSIPNDDVMVSHGYISGKTIPKAEATKHKTITYTDVITCIWQDAVKNNYGQNYALKMVVSGIQIRPRDNVNAAIQAPIPLKFYQNYGVGFASISPWNNYSGSGANATFDASKKKAFGVRFCVTMSVLNPDGSLVSSGKLALGFSDLDTRGLNYASDDYSGTGYDDYKESIRLYKSQVDEACVYKDADNCLTHYFPFNPDFSCIEYSGTRPTGDAPGQPSSTKAALSWRGSASGTSFYWAGSRACVTAVIGLSGLGLPVYNGYVYVKHQQKDGTYDAGVLAQTKQWLSGQNYIYLYNWVRGSTEPENVYDNTMSFVASYSAICSCSKRFVRLWKLFSVCALCRAVMYRVLFSL